MGRLIVAGMVVFSIYLAITGQWWAIASVWFFGGIFAFLFYAALDATLHIGNFIRGLFKVDVRVQRETVDDHAAMIALYRERTGQKLNGHGDPTRGD